MASKPLTTEQILIILAENPSQITALTTDLESGLLHAPADDGGWSVNEVLAHLRSCADVWGDCMATIIAEDRPTIRAINPRTWIKKTNYPQQEFQSSLPAFIAQRARLLAMLEPLTPEEWSRSATVTGAGKPLERTVQFYAQWLAKHERTHLKQIKRIVEAMYT